MVFSCLVVAPRFTTEEYSETITIKAGTEQVFELPFVGAPQPEVKWTLNSSPVTDTRMKIENVRNKTTLTIKASVREDSGSYEVKLTNAAGECTKTIRLIVIGKLSEPHCILPNTCTCILLH